MLCSNNKGSNKFNIQMDNFIKKIELYYQLFRNTES